KGEVPGSRYPHVDQIGEERIHDEHGHRHGEQENETKGYANAECKARAADDLQHLSQLKQAQMQSDIHVGGAGGIMRHGLRPNPQKIVEPGYQIESAEIDSKKNHRVAFE